MSLLITVLKGWLIFQVLRFICIVWFNPAAMDTKSAKKAKKKAQEERDYITKHQEYLAKQTNNPAYKKGSNKTLEVISIVGIISLLIVLSI
jgi:hypothetical protein